MKNRKIYIFRKVNGTWLLISERNQITLAEFLRQLQIVVDDNTQFARIIQVEKGVQTTIEYRAYTGAYVQINVNSHPII